jgi:hypothetical protein
LLKRSRQEPNTPPLSAEKQHISQVGAAKGAVENADSHFAAAVAGIMGLPLTDAEKAEAIRRLLAGKGEGK